MLRFKHHLILVINCQFIGSKWQKKLNDNNSYKLGLFLKGGKGGGKMTLAEGTVGSSYTVLGVNTEDEELDDFLFTLGCYSGEKITLVSIMSENFVTSIRDGRYSLSHDLADTILVELA